jgi:flagellar assembly protein FliH
MSSSRARPAAVPVHWALEDLAGAGGAVHLAASPEDRVPVVDIEEVEHQAYARGYQDGQLAGVQAEAARMRAALSAMDDALLRLQGEAEAWVGNARENVCAIAIAVARQVLMREIEGDPSMVAALATRALTEIPVDQPVIVRMHPDDLRVLESLPDEAGTSRASLNGDRSQVQWVADPRVARGGCLLEGRDRIIDGRIDTGLERLYRRLTATDA